MDEVELDVAPFQKSSERKKLGLVRNGQDDGVGSRMCRAGLTGGVDDLPGCKAIGEIAADHDVVVVVVRFGSGARNALRVKLGSTCSYGKHDPQIRQVLLGIQRDFCPKP